MIYTMKLHQDPYDRIKVGTKSVEIRLNDEKRQNLNIGDGIIFSNIENLTDISKVTITNIKKFDNFYNLFQNYDSSHLWVDMSHEEYVNSMYQYYKPEQEEMHGVCAIEFRLDSIPFDAYEIWVRLNVLSQWLPRFEDGRIDYTESDSSVVLNCFVRVGDEMLLMKRSDKVSTYQGKWHIVAGYVDEFVSIEDKVMEELREETGILPDKVKEFKIIDSFTVSNDDTWKERMVYSTTVELIWKPEVELNWEHTDYRWIKPEQIVDFDTVPKLVDKMKRQGYL